MVPAFHPRPLISARSERICGEAEFDFWVIKVDERVWREFPCAVCFARVELMFRALWWLLTLPFRLLGWVVELLGRIAALIVGFGLMVVGVAFWAGTIYFVGIPLFIVGLLLTLRALG
jgi:hypothetical protein